MTDLEAFEGFARSVGIAFFAFLDAIAGQQAKGGRGQGEMGGYYHGSLPDGP
jgi:hypothetical protein